MPDGNKLFIHYEEEQFPVWIEYVNTKTDKSVKLYQRKNRTAKLRKKENFTRKLTHRANPLLPSVGSW